MTQTIYQILCDNLKPDNTLPAGFRLPTEETTSTAISWEPGALDGVSRYHMQTPAMNYEQARILANAVETASAGNYAKAEELFHAWTKDFQCIYGIEHLHQYIRLHQGRVNNKEILGTALFMIANTNQIECVKAALSILEIFPIIMEDVKEIIRRLGVYEEFTLFVVWIMMHWPNNQEEIFSLAKKVHGWGKIHAVEYLEPQNEEIRKWLLRDGCDNTISPCYTCLACWNKSQAEDILYNDPTQEEYQQIGALLKGLLEEGPVPGGYSCGMEALEESQEILEAFVKISSRYKLTLNEYDLLLNILEWAQIHAKDSSLSENCERILSTSECANAVFEALANGDGLSLAQALGIPFQEPLLQCLSKDFDKHFQKAGILLQDPAYTEKTLEVFRKNMDVSQEDSLSNPFEKPFNQLQFLLPQLTTLPLKGIDFVKAGLANPSVLHRRAALDVIQHWMHSTDELPQDLWDILQEIKETDSRQAIQDLVKEIISHVSSPIDRKA